MTIWRKVHVNKRIVQGHSGYIVQLPYPLSEWDAWSRWEVERFISIERNLGPSDILFDIGTEQGAISAVYASFGPQMCLFEPTPQFWPNIRQTWKMNGLREPLGTFVGLCSDRDVEPASVDHSTGYKDGWPLCAWSDELSEARSYRYVHEHAGISPQVRLDTWAAEHGIVPTAITIDVEGAELIVLRGAERILRTHHPLVWCSVHPDLMERDYAVSPVELFAYMEEMGYYRRYLEEDHEQHFAFYHPLGRPLVA